MPTFRHGRDTYLAVGDDTATGGVLTDISNTLRDVSFPITLDTPETTAFGSTVKTYVVGIKDARFSCSGMFDATTDALLESIYGLASARKLEYGPEGNGTGAVKYSTANDGTDGVILVSYQIQGTVSDMVSASLEFQITGDIVRGTFA